MQYKLCDDPWGREERAAIANVVESNIFTMGARVRQCETEFAKKVSSKHAIMVNSGSSANLLAIAALVYSGKLPRGSEVIVPAVSWSTTYAPLEQFGMKVVFVDIDRNTLNIDVDALCAAVTEKTKMVFLVNLLGNANEFDRILEICTAKNIIVIEDNCESLGATYQGRCLGTLGVLGTYSTFYSHHICTMEGGVVVTDDDTLYEYMLAIRAHGWTRNLPNDSTIYQKQADHFYESFRFIVPGFNLRPLEMEAAIGIEQLKKVDTMIAQRRKNAKHFFEVMKSFPELRVQKEIGDSSWFGFSLVLQGRLAGKRDSLISKLVEANIEVRPIVAGNFTRNPVIKYFDYRIPSPLTNADDIHFNGFFVGNHSKDNSAEIDYFASTLKSVLDKV